MMKKYIYKKIPFIQCAAPVYQHDQIKSSCKRICPMRCVPIKREFHKTGVPVYQSLHLCGDDMHLNSFFAKYYKCHVYIKLK